MRFQVPQFIEVEDKIFGPLTLKQFIYIAGGAGLSVLFYIFLPAYASILLIVPTMAFAGALAFFKINNKPFITMVEAAFKYTKNPKLYIWIKEENEAVEAKKEEAAENPMAYIPKLSNSKLKELTWSLDTKESLNPVTRDAIGAEKGIGIS
jgi:hypothetical protein